MSLETAFNKFKEKIGKAVEDAASLEVTTFTGDFSYKSSDFISGVAQESKFDIADVVSKLAMKTDVDMQLVAYTKISIDSDTVNIVKDDLSAEDAELVELHKTMVEAAQKSRAAIIEMVQKLVKIK